MFRSAATALAGSHHCCCLVGTVTQVTLQQICSPACDPDHDFADQPTPLAACAGGLQHCSVAEV